jgi:hypothetical protein
VPTFLLSKSVFPESFRGLDFEAPSFWEGWTIFATAKNGPKNKKPGVERRAQPPVSWWLRAKLDKMLPCARKAPHYRICTWEYFRPDCESPARPAAFWKPRTISNTTTAFLNVKYP